MARKRTTYSGVARGDARNPKPYLAEVLLTNDQALDIIRHLAEALTYKKGVMLTIHWGKKTGKPPTNRIEIRTGNL